MYHQWSHLKSRAIQMRRRGASLRDVATRLGIAKSTLSHWFRHITLSSYHKKLLQKRHEVALVKARKEAIKWHNTQKARRLERAQEDASALLSNIDMKDTSIVELALALLYLGEGMKKSISTAMGNSDPLILRFFVSALEHLYDVPRTDMKCEIHIRADQDPNEIIRYWSKTLHIPAANFSKPSIDKRTAGRPTYLHYKGVCVVRCSRVAIQRKLMYIATTFCGEIADGMRA